MLLYQGRGEMILELLRSFLQFKAAGARELQP